MRLEEIESLIIDKIGRENIDVFVEEENIVTVGTLSVTSLVDEIYELSKEQLVKELCNKFKEIINKHFEFDWIGDEPKTNLFVDLQNIEIDYLTKKGDKE